MVADAVVGSTRRRIPTGELEISASRKGQSRAGSGNFYPYVGRRFLSILVGYLRRGGSQREESQCERHAAAS